MDEGILKLIKDFDCSGTILADGKRNVIRKFNYNNREITIKSFKIPFFFLGIIYKFFRSSKAKRSYEFAKKLESCKIGTPKPIMFYENFDFLRLKDSYYVSDFVDANYTLRDVFNFSEKDLKIVLSQFAFFCFQLHENGIEFLDHSPGNTLIKKISDEKYEFYLIDLNRMKFHKEMSVEQRMKNLCRLTPNKFMVEFISKEYAKFSSNDHEKLFELMWKYTTNFFQNR